MLRIGRNALAAPGMRYRGAVCAAAIVTLGVQAHAETVVPMQGQTPQQIQADTDACKAQSKTAYDQALAAAKQAPATSATTASAPAPSGGRVRGAAAGAVAGAAAAEVRGNQYENYDKVDSDVQQEYRQNQAQSADAASKQAFSSCMSGKGYTIGP